jgi:hypothetical protein
VGRELQTKIGDVAGQHIAPDVAQMCNLVPGFNGALGGAMTGSKINSKTLSHDISD